MLHVNKKKRLYYFMLTLDVSAESPLTEDGNASIVGVCGEKKVRVWESCCFKVDSECAMYIVQTVIGGGVDSILVYKTSNRNECREECALLGVDRDDVWVRIHETEEKEMMGEKSL